MDKAVLVSIDIEMGARILKILDDANLRVSVALWAFLAEYDDWRLILSSRKFDAAGILEGYGLLHSALNAAGVTVNQMPTTMILPMTDPLIRTLRKSFRQARSVDGMRLGGQLIGDRFIEDAYVYRVA